MCFDFVSFIMYFLQLFIPILLVYASSHDDVVFISGNNFCITSGSSAMAFNKEIRNTPEKNEISKFYPTTSDPFYFACDLDVKCAYSLYYYDKVWKVNSSLAGFANEYVTDRRWEAFQLIKTLHVTGNNDNLRFYGYILANPDSEFIIQFSVRGKQDGNIFLCDNGTHPTNSNCYWIMLAAFSGTKSTIRKCTSNQIPYNNGENYEYACGGWHIENNSTDVLNEDSWRHFTIIREGYTVKVLRGKENFLELPDKNILDLKKLYFHSKYVDVLWKLHNNYYLYSDTVGESQLGPLFRITGHYLCVSMFLALCGTCSLTIKIEAVGGIHIGQEKFFSTNETWKEIKVNYYISSEKQYEQFQMFLNRQRTRPNDGPGFWAIDDIRLCHLKEYRYIESDESDTPCQSIAIQEDAILAFHESDKIETLGVKCPENSFGEWCVPCYIFGSEFCSNIKYCEYLRGRKECYCSPGFQEENCGEQCRAGTYGHGCQQKCSENCKEGECRHIDGICMESPIEGMKIETRPQSPYEVRFIWEEDNDLKLSWYQPNETNRLLIKFKVHLYNEYNHTYQTKPIAETYSSEFLNSSYIMIYSVKIKGNLFLSCSNYKLIIRYCIKHSCSSSTPLDITTPPDIPADIPEDSIHYNSTNTTITVRMEDQSDEHVDYKKNIYIVVSKFENEKDLLEFADSLKIGEEPLLKRSGIVLKYERYNNKGIFVIGDNSSSSNRPLEPDTNYSIALILLNECYGTVRITKMQEYIKTQGNPILYVSEEKNLVGEDEKNFVGEDEKNLGKDENNLVGEDKKNGALWALILLLFIPLAGLGYWFIKHKPQFGWRELVLRRNLHVDGTNLTELQTRTTMVDIRPPNMSVPTQVLPPPKPKYSNEIKLDDFVGYVKRAIETGELESQHHLFRRGLLQKCEEGSKAENKQKNRYKNLIAYDHSRVKLRMIPGDKHSDYINANYIDGNKKPKIYIATQGPKSSTVADFWRMVWQENVNNIVMVTNVFENGQNKVEKYWPDINETSKHDGIKIKFVSEKVFANFDLRVFGLSYKREQRQVEQLHFTTWPDHGVPLYPQSLVPFLQRITEMRHDPSSPILVHCSAGVGRTGTIILCDIILDMAADGNSVDFLANLEKLRNQRANMVDNVEQYKLAHMVVMDCLFGMRTAIPCSRDMEQLVKTILENDGVAQQMEYLHESQWQDSVMETKFEKEDPAPIFAHKNRFQEIVPEHYRVYLSRYPDDDPASSYINAVSVDDFRNPGRYIVTQQPMPTTLGDFWRLLVERGCSVIINLNRVNTEDKTVCKFWPTKGEEMKPVDFLVVRHVKTKKLEFYEITTVLVVTEDPKRQISVDIISMNKWKPRDLLPDNTEEFLAFRDAADAIARNSKNVLVTCYDGATASGLYLAMSFLIEKMKLEQECDVCLAVRSIRHSRRHFVTTQEQYEFLFKASVSFIKGFQSYANFD